MDLGTTEEPKPKRVKLSLEILPETPISQYDVEGKEEHEKLMTPEDRFMTYVRQLDFLGKNTKPEAKQTDQEDSKWEKLRKKVDFHLGRATGEMTQMVELINMLKNQPENLTVIPCTKPPLPLKTQQDQILCQIGFKQSQLQKASERLSQAALRLESDVNRFRQYVNETNKLRQNWKVGCPVKTIPQEYAPIFNVDFSFRNDGSRVRSLPPTVILTDDSNKGIQVKIPVDQLSRSLLLSNSNCKTEIPILFPIENKNLKNNICTFSGFEEIHEMFCNAQESLFTWEIYDTLLKAVQKSKKILYEQTENQLKFECNNEQVFSIKLKTQKEGNFEGDNGDNNGDVLMEVEEEKKKLRFGDDFIFRLMGLLLHYEIRKKHKKQMNEDHRPKLTKDFLRENQIELDEPVLQNIIQLYEHLQCLGQVIEALDQLSLKTKKSFSYQTVNTDNAFIASFDLFFDSQLFTCLHIKKGQITTSSIEYIKSVPQLIQSLLALINHLQTP